MRGQPWHILRRMLDAPVPVLDGEEDSKPGAKTLGKSAQVKGGGCIGQDKVEDRNPKLLRQPQMMETG